jgi:very-short-patch-repair endonuclease
LHGVASRRELLAAGVGSRAIQTRTESGRYVRICPGVYAIGHADLTVAGRRRAIVLACGPAAVLSHRSAAAAWGLRPDGGTYWDVTVRHPSARAPDAPVRVFRHRTLRDDEVTTHDGIPVTTVARTLLDLAAVVPAHQLRRAVEAAEQQRLFDLRQVDRTLQAHPRRPGRPALADLLVDLREHGITKTRSDTEAHLLQLCVDHDLPRPQVNHTNNGKEVDFRWPDHQLLVEVDGWTTHHTRTAFTTDRRRDRAALREGFRVARFTATEVDRNPTEVAEELRLLLQT